MCQILINSGKYFIKTFDIKNEIYTFEYQMCQKTTIKFLTLGLIWV